MGKARSHWLRAYTHAPTTGLRQHSPATTNRLPPPAPRRTHSASDGHRPPSATRPSSAPERCPLQCYPPEHWPWALPAQRYSPEWCPRALPFEFYRPSLVRGCCSARALFLGATRPSGVPERCRPSSTGRVSSSAAARLSTVFLSTVFGCCPPQRCPLEHCHRALPAPVLPARPPGAYPVQRCSPRVLSAPAAPAHRCSPQCLPPGRCRLQRCCSALAGRADSARALSAPSRPPAMPAAALPPQHCPPGCCPLPPRVLSAPAVSAAAARPPMPAVDRAPTGRRHRRGSRRGRASAAIPESADHRNRRDRSGRPSPRRLGPSLPRFPRRARTHDNAAPTPATARSHIDQVGHRARNEVNTPYRTTKPASWASNPACVRLAHSSFTSIRDT